MNATTVTLTITLPDQTVATPTVTNPPAVTGTYGYDYPSTGGALLAGRYLGVWLFTMATGKTTAYAEVFDVSAADPGWIVSLSAVKSHLNITSTTNDDELGIFIGTATDVAEYFVGPIVVSDYTQRVSARNPRLTHLPSMGPRRTPVLTLTSLTPLYTSGTTWSAASVVVDPATGEVRQSSGACIWGGPWIAQYTAGQQSVPGKWQLAGLIVVQHLWETQRGASSLPLAAAAETFIPSMGFAIPNRARDLLLLDQMAGFA